MMNTTMRRWSTWMSVIAFSALVALMIVGCGSSEKVSDQSDDHALPEVTDLARLHQWMTGSFSSQEQAEADTNFFDIRLRMVPIWQQLSDAHWIYVEQAAASSLDQPYRQRVYRVWQVDDTTFQSDVYTFEDPLRFAGAWQNPNPLASLTPDSLTLREGCSIVMHPEGDSAFVGGTVGEGCASTLRGASYATSEVRITADGMVTWDRGYDAEGNQAWGAETGGYVFMKITEPEVAGEKPRVGEH
ncbi:hypothetical protein GF377_01650 [candidate division GN15 bacterium]|nr:hypothetical protein [candidate division GN15 bacterium]